MKEGVLQRQPKAATAKPPGSPPRFRRRGRAGRRAGGRVRAKKVALGYYTSIGSSDKVAAFWELSVGGYTANVVVQAVSLYLQADSLRRYGPGGLRYDARSAGY